MMKKFQFSLLIVLMIAAFSGCKKDNYPGATLSPYISVFDLRNIYRGQDLQLNTENMFGADKIKGLVVSDHSGKNMPEGVLVVQDSRRLGYLRGISIAAGDEAANYMPGDSVTIKIDGATLKLVDSLLMITNLPKGAIEKNSTGNPVEPLIVRAVDLITNPGDYQSTLVTLTKVGFDPSYPPGSTYEGDKIINDGFGDMMLHTASGTTWAGKKLPFMSNFTGVVFTNANGQPILAPRTEDDIQILSATAPKITPVVITGFLANADGADGNYEYIQFMATRDIDFSQTPFAVVTTNNAGSALPLGPPVDGWATGQGRTYKFNLTSGTVAKGEYFYVGSGNKKISGSASDEMANVKWFGKPYATENGDDYGNKTSNLLANSGNAAGIAIFDHKDVTAESVPVDVIFYGGNGTVFSEGPPPVGYRITNTDYYDEKNPSTLEDQPFFKQGSNTGKFSFPTGESFAQLPGVYNVKSGRWTQARLLQNVTLTLTSTSAEIEGHVSLEQ
ncbi:MAG: DUF5689 domain-containing protein [Flavisolibacter sp.]